MGYEVKLQPTAEQLPEFLVGLDPDLIASGNGESVVVEVRARRDFENEQAITALETAVRHRPGWRFELIIEGSDKEERSSLGLSQIGTSLKEANELQQRGHIVAVLLLLWSATEGILRLIAVRENVDLESPAPVYLIKRLYTLGFLGREQFKILDEAVRLRN